MKPRMVELVRDADVPPDRGRLLDAAAVASEVLCGTVSRSWVIRNLKGAGSGRVTMGRRTVMFWEADVRRWLERRTAKESAA